jgi:hypothetical protein
MIKPLPDLSTRYNKLRGTSFSIISGLATLITHLGGEEISVQEVKIFTRQAKNNVLELHAASMPPKMPSPPPVITTRNAPPPQVPQDPILPPGQIKSSLKTGKFHPVIASTPPPPARSNKPVQIQMTRKMTLVSTVKLLMGLEMEHI